MSADYSTFFEKNSPMAFWNRKKKTNIEEERSISLTGLGFNTLSSFSNTMALRLSVVYGAVNMISNSVAVLPMNIVEVGMDSKRKIKHPLYQVLNGKPDIKMNHFQFMKMMVESLFLRGNAYAYIVRDEQLNVKNLIYLDANNVTPVIQDDGSVKYLVNGLPELVEAINMIHILQHPNELYQGQSTITYATNALKIASDTEKHAENFFKSGANLSGVLKASAPLTNEQKTQIRDSWVNAFDSSNNRVNIAVLPQGIDYQSISVSAQDAELLETRKYNTVELCRFFNISPIKLFDYSNTSYSTLEQVQLSYLSETILPIAQMFEDEFNLKLFKPSQVGSKQVDFDFDVLLQTDKDSEVKYYRELLVNGIVSLNEVRSKLGFEPIEGGENHVIQLSYASLADVLSGKYVKNQNDTLDNKVKSKDSDLDNSNENNNDKNTEKK